MNKNKKEIDRRRTFGIISHPDAGKTTLTEKLLLYGGAIQQAGAVKARKALRYATSDWMAIEKERGISVTTSVMKFNYNGFEINLLDTPGHQDFSEDTYRVLTAVDSALMVIDGAKGVEPQTEKLMEVCRMRNTPIITFINKLDREGMAPLDILNDIENKLQIECTPLSWPVGMGKRFKGVYNLYKKELYLFMSGQETKSRASIVINYLSDPTLDKILGSQADELREDIELIEGAANPFELDHYLKGNQTPVFFGSAINNFGVNELLEHFVKIAPSPLPRSTTTRIVEPAENKFSGFVFKIQANMDPAHRDRIAFLRICSGSYRKGMKMRHVRIGRDVQVSNAVTFLASDRGHVEEAYTGDIIGLHNHGTIRIGDTFTQGEDLKFTGIPNFAPELFRRAILKDPLRMKALQKGLDQLCEEGATQLFRPLKNNALILGAVGILQFDVVAHRLKSEYGVECQFESVSVATARWIECEDSAMEERFRVKAYENLGEDQSGALVYIAPTRVNLDLAIEKWPEIRFLSTREH